MKEQYLKSCILVQACLNKGAEYFIILYIRNLTLRKSLLPLSYITFCLRKKKMTSAHLEMFTMDSSDGAPLVEISTDSSTPPKASLAANVLNLDLSVNTKVTAHPGDNSKGGYVTINSVCQSKGISPNVRLSKTSYEKLAKKFDDISEALSKKTAYHLMLTRKQHVMITQIAHQDKEPHYYISILHTLHQKDTIQPSDEIVNTKTINLAPEEFAKLSLLRDSMLQVIRSKNATSQTDESSTITGWIWESKISGMRSCFVFLNREDCVENAALFYWHLNSEHIQGQEPALDHESQYIFTEVTIPRPNKLNVIEQVLYATLIRDLMAMNIYPHGYGIDQGHIDKVKTQFDMSIFKVVVKKVLLLLGYKNLHMCNDLVDIVFYNGAMEKVCATLTPEYVEPAAGELYALLIDYCYQTACQEIVKE